MQISNIDLRLIRVFDAVVECGGFAAAQPYLNITTSTISTHISDFETRLGFRLCERGRGGFKLTPRGKLAFEEGRRLLAEINDYSANVATLRERLAGRLSIGMVDAVTSFEGMPLVEVIREINEGNPHVAFSLEINNRHELERAVLDGRLHVAVGPFVRDIVGLDFIDLFRETHHIYCGRGHPFFEREDAVSREELADVPAVIRDYNVDFDREQFGSIAASAHATTVEAVSLFVLTGRFVGFLPEHFAKQWVDRGVMRILQGEGFTYDSRHVLITKRGARMSAVLSDFSSRIIERSRRA